MAGTQNSSLNLNLQNARWNICDKLKRQDILKYSMTKNHQKKRGFKNDKRRIGRT